MIGLTLGGYLSARFLRMILAVFITMFGTIYIVDFVEMLRRTGGIAGVSAGFVALLSLLRAPSASEQLMPFCVLCGAMGAFLDLTRKLELLIARAVGVSVWGFLVPPALVAIALGVASVGLYNPLSASMKQKADAIEARLFGRNGKASEDGPLWIRQNDVDGHAIIKAEKVEGDGARLKTVTAFIYDREGKFEARVNAKTADLLPGVWRFKDARIMAPGDDAAEVGVYLLATDLVPEEVGKSILAPDCVPFWDLFAWSRRIESAGLDPTAYQLQLQTLLARPLQFVAMVLIAAVFSLRFFRFGGIGKMVGSGLCAGFVLYAATKLVGDFGDSGLLSPAVAAWSPAIVASMLGALALLQQEDG